MTKLSAGVVVALSGLTIAVAAASAGVAKDGDMHPPRQLHRCERLEAEAERGGRAHRGRVRGRPEPQRRELERALFQNGSQIARGTRVTRGPSGSFEFRKVAPNTAGTDSFRARATRASGEVCTGRASASFGA